MRLTGPMSERFDPDRIVDPTRRGEVAWSDFNQAYHRLQETPWRAINRDRPYGAGRRLLRLFFAWWISRNDAFLDLGRKARAFARLPIGRDPNVVFYGAEVGWEAYVLQAVFGDGGRVVLIDADEEAFARHQSAPPELSVRGPDGPLSVVRSPERTEYVRSDFFDFSAPGAFNVGIDWGLLEHYPGEAKLEVIGRFRENLSPGGLQISAVPRNSFAMRTYYAAFSDELNFGYRELLSRSELVDVWEQAGWRVVDVISSPSTHVAAVTPA